MDQVKAFASWYSWRGEQTACLWFEESMAQGKLDVDFMPVDTKVPYDETENNLTITINPS